MTATIRPLTRANSSTLSFFSSSLTSRSLRTPAQPQTAMPAMQTTTPPRMIWPEPLAAKPASSPLNRGGIRKPKMAQKPRATAMPRAIPR